jgi:opacity protein-like surface antigen
MRRELLKSALAMAVLAVAASQAACAAPSQVCPSRVHVASGALAAADIPAGFQATFSDSQVWLSGFSVFEGPPAQGASLVPDSGRAEAATWKFSRPAADGYWLSCDYANGLIHLAVRADDKATSCRGSFKTSGDPKLPQAEFSCR